MAAVQARHAFTLDEQFPKIIIVVETFEPERKLQNPAFVTGNNKRISGCFCWECYGKPFFGQRIRQQHTENPPTPLASISFSSNQQVVGSSASLVHCRCSWRPRKNQCSAIRESTHFGIRSVHWEASQFPLVPLPMLIRPFIVVIIHHNTENISYNSAITFLSDILYHKLIK